MKEWGWGVAQGESMPGMRKACVSVLFTIHCVLSFILTQVNFRMQNISVLQYEMRKLNRGC